MVLFPAHLGSGGSSTCHLGCFPLPSLALYIYSSYPLLQHKPRHTSVIYYLHLFLVSKVILFDRSMLNSKKLFQMAKKWQKKAVLGRRRIMSTGTGGDAQSDNCSPSIANRGHLFVYTSDRKRFTIPLGYLRHYLFRELFRLSEEEFGLPRDGPIILPCDASCMERVISQVRRPGVRCSTSSMSLQRQNQQPSKSVYGF